MFVTGLTYHNIIDREPAIADYIPNYATTLQTRIDEAKAVIDNRLRAMGYDLEKIGKKTDVWDWDNESAQSISKTVTGIESGQRLFIIMTPSSYTAELQISTSKNYPIIIEIITITAGVPFCVLLPDTESTLVFYLTLDNVFFGVETIKAYLTDPAIYFIHLYKSLELIYETMRSAPGDLFEMKSNYYHNLYETEFNSLATYYDRNGNGVIEQGETQHLKRTRILR